MFILIIYLLIFIDKSSTLSGYVASVSPIKLSKPKKSHNNHMKPPKQYFNFICMDKSQHNQGCIIKKVKLNEENTDFVLIDFTTITKTKLGYDKAEHQLNFISLA